MVTLRALDQLHLGWNSLFKTPWTMFFLFSATVRCPALRLKMPTCMTCTCQLTASPESSWPGASRAAWQSPRKIARLAPRRGPVTCWHSDGGILLHNAGNLIGTLRPGLLQLALSFASAQKGSYGGFRTLAAWFYRQPWGRLICISRPSNHAAEIPRGSR